MTEKLTEIKAGYFTLTSGDCLSGNGKEVCAMNALEVLTLVLVIFAVLTYLDNHHKK